MITILCVTTANHYLSKLAIEKTIENCPFEVRVLTFSDKPIHKDEQFIKIKKFDNANGYNNFLLSNFSSYIETDYFLVVQYDGFAVDKMQWSNDFFNYDYIGAPWIDKGSKFRVGNGGFSLRSKKLQLAIEKEKLKLLPNKKHGLNEDRIICDYARKRLEKKYNINFANIEIADRFSFEKVKTNKKTFGFHGFWNVPKFTSESFTIDYIRNFENFNYAKKQKLKKTLLQKNYQQALTIL